jgi:ADP-heptose:LPS heptosyltransferase
MSAELLPQMGPGAIVLCRPDRVGDAIIASACFPAVREKFPERPLYFLARQVMAPLYEGHPMLDGFLPRPESAPELVQKLRDIGTAIFVHLHTDPLCYRAAWSAGVPTRIGYRHWLGWTLTDSRTDERSAGLQHERDYNFDVLSLIGIHNTRDARPSVHLPDAALTSLRQKLAGAELGDAEPYAVINPTAHSATLRWAPEKFAALAQRMHAAYGWRIVLTSGGDADPSVLRLREAIGDAPYLFDLSGQTNLAETGWLLRGAHMLVGRDTGTSHLAAAVDCPVVSIFGRMESTYCAARWAALTSPGRGKIVESPVVEMQRFESSASFWSRGFDAVSVDLVMSSVTELAAAGHAPLASPISCKAQDQAEA